MLAGACPIDTSLPRAGASRLGGAGGLLALGAVAALYAFALVRHTRLPEPVGLDAPPQVFSAGTRLGFPAAAKSQSLCCTGQSFAERLNGVPAANDP